jgi:hypothetical protein
MGVMKVIFLDIDGVLTTQSTGWKSFHPECLASLKHLLDNTDAKMVLSSCWRHGFIDWTDKNHSLVDAKDSKTVIKQWFMMAGWSQELADRLIDHTPTLSSGHRGSEISTWLSKHPEVTEFCILDDDCDMEPHTDKHVWTSGDHGMNMSDSEKAIALLQKSS